MSRVKLGDVAQEYKATVKDCSNLPIVGLEHLTPGEITLERWDEGTENTFTKGFKKGQMLFGRRRAYLKKAAVAPFDGVCSGDITVIEAIPGKILPELLPFIIQNDLLFDYAVGKSAGSLSPRVKWVDLKDYEFELPEIEKQASLVDLLKAAHATRKAYQEQIKATDDLVKSQFIEMFGTDEFPVCALSEECDLITKGTTPTTIGFNFTDDGVNFVKIENIDEHGNFNREGMMFISETCHDAMKRSQLKEDDILFSIAGAIGRCAVVSSDILPANINQALAIIRLRNGSVLDRKFVMAALKSDYVIEQYMELKRGVAQLNLSLKNIGDFRVPVPPIDAQKRYVAFVEQSDKSKFELQQAIEKVDNLIKSLIQQDNN